MLPQIQKAIEQAPLGSVTEPIASPIGMHIIRVDDRKPSEFRPFEEVKEEVRSMGFQLKSEEADIVWIKEQKDKNYIESRVLDTAARGGLASMPRIAFHTNA